MALVRGHLSLKGEAMLRLVLLLLYLASWYSSGHANIGGGWDPDGAPTVNLHGNLDPNGLTAQTPPPTVDLHGNLDPDG